MLHVLRLSFHLVFITKTVLKCGVELQLKRTLEALVYHIIISKYCRTTDAKYEVEGCWNLTNQR
jgi:hypothetical protein